MAMEDFRVDVVVGKGPGATAIPLEIPPFTLVGATTRAGLCPARCATASASPRHMDFYEPPSCARCSSARRGSSASRHRRGCHRDLAPVPGHASDRQRLLRRVRDYAEEQADGTVSPRGRQGRGSAVYEVDELGLDRLDRGVLDALVPALRRGPGRLSARRGSRPGRSLRDGRRGCGAVPRACRAASREPRAVESPARLKDSSRAQAARLAPTPFWPWRCSPTTTSSRPGWSVPCRLTASFPGGVT